MNTPLLKLTYKYKNSIKHVILKDESKNITGSIKIRPAKNIIDSAYRLGLLKAGQSVSEVTSGNMGIGLAEALKPYKNPLTIYMPSFMSEERKQILTSMGANLVLTKDFKEAFALAEQDKNSFYVKQFENRFNADSYKSLIDEVEPLWNEFPAFIAGVGTGGTLNGVGHILKEKYGTHIFAIDPAESKLLLTGFNNGAHEIEGLSDGFIPDLYPKEIVEGIFPVSSNDAICMARKINDQFKVGVGISSGAYLLGAILTGIDNIFTVFPDNVNRYYSTKLFDDNLHSDLVDSIELLKIEEIKNTRS